MDRRSERRGARTSCCLVCCLAMRSARSLASDPELTKKHTCSLCNPANLAQHRPFADHRRLENRRGHLGWKRGCQSLRIVC
eukprot:3577552-Rhodomonas_salina.1